MMPQEDQDRQDPEILKKIKEVEARVEEMAAQSREEARRIVKEAKERAGRLLMDRRRDLERKASEYHLQGTKAAEEEGRQIIEEARRQVQELRDRAEPKIEEAADLVLRRVFPVLGEGETQ